MIIEILAMITEFSYQLESRGVSFYFIKVFNHSYLWPLSIFNEVLTLDYVSRRGRYEPSTALHVAAVTL